MPNDRVRERLAPASRMANQEVRVKDEVVGICEPVTPTNGMSLFERLDQRLGIDSAVTASKSKPWQGDLW